MQEQGAQYGETDYESGCTEWNCTAMSSPYSDRPWNAAFAVKMVRMFLDAKLDYATFFGMVGHPEMPMPLYMIMKATDFDAALEKNADAGIVVSTIGLPQDAPRMKFWKTSADKRPMLFLIGTPSGQITGLAAAVAKGDIAGVVVSNPEAKYDVAAPSDPNEAFDIRYVLVDKSNVEQYKNQLM